MPDLGPVQAAAQDAMARGWAVFPVVGKVPDTKHGLLDASTDPKLAVIWFERWPNRGVAVATGKTSGVWVLDLDSEAAKDRLVELQTQNGKLPDTVVAKTARGYHAYYRQPEGVEIRNSAGKVAEGIDVRGTGGYVVMPPSPHPDGTAYRWAAKHSPADIEPAVAPDWLLALVQEQASNGKHYAPELPHQIGQGGRNQALTSLAGTLRRRAASRETILAALRAENEQRCVPPLPDVEVLTITDSVARYEPAPPQPAPRVPVLDVIDSVVLARIRDEKLLPLSVVKTPWGPWNSVSRGAGGGEGLAHGWHVIVGASSGAGKSLCATNLVAKAVRAGEHVCLISLEMSQAEVVTRLLAIYAREEARKLEHGAQFSAEAWDRASDKLQESGGSIRVNQEPIATLAQIASAIEHYAEQGCRTFIVDYLQLAWVRNAETMNSQITEVSHTIRGLARKHRILTIGLSQVNRMTSGSGGELRKEGLLGGSSLENDADQVLLLGKPENTSPGIYRSEAKIDKNRHGPPIDWQVILDTRTLEMRDAMPDEQPHSPVAEPKPKRSKHSKPTILR